MSKFSDFYNTPLGSNSVSALDETDIDLNGIYSESEEEEEADNGVTTAEFLAQVNGDGTADSDDQRISEEIARIATPIMAKDLMGEEEVEEFKESIDAFDAMDESYFTERTIVKMDKQAKLAKLKKIAILTIAKEKNDNMYKKLEIAWRIERTIERRLEKKYASYAMVKVREYLNKAKNSKSTFIKKIANKVSGGHSSASSKKPDKVNINEINKIKLPGVKM